MQKLNKAFKVSVRDIELHCNIYGGGPNILLCLTGAVAPSHWAFSSQLEYFGANGSDFTVVTYDPRGYGYSQSTPRAFSVTPEHHTKIDARDVYELMKSLGYQKYFVLGWCDGGLTAIYLASLFPDAVKGIIVWGTRAYYTERDLEVSERIRDVSTFRSDYREVFEAVYGSQSTYQVVWGMFTDSVHATYEHVKMKNGELCSEEMNEIMCPTLILHGAKDAMTNLFQAQFIKDSIRHSELIVLDNGSHFMQKNLPMDFNLIVERFLKKFV